MKDYLEQLLDCGRKYVYGSCRQTNEVLTDIEKYEFAGHMLKHDLATKPMDIAHIVGEIMEYSGYHVIDLIAAYAIEDSADKGFDLLQEVKAALIHYYALAMQCALEDAWQERDTARHEEAGQHLRVDQQTGEQHWSKY